MPREQIYGIHICVTGPDKNIGAGHKGRFREPYKAWLALKAPNLPPRFSINRLNRIAEVVPRQHKVGSDDRR